MQWREKADACAPAVGAGGQASGHHASYQKAALDERNKQRPDVPTVWITDPNGKRAPYIDTGIARAVSQEVLAKRDAAEARGKSDVWRGPGSIMHRHNNTPAGRERIEAWLTP